MSSYALILGVKWRLEKHVLIDGIHGVTRMQGAVLKRRHRPRKSVLGTAIGESSAEYDRRQVLRGKLVVPTVEEFLH